MQLMDSIHGNYLGFCEQTQKYLTSYQDSSTLIGLLSLPSDKKLIKDIGSK
ncbi:hypothetical protein HispidOSU_014083, partial [Sigmodon hispidus]